MSATAEICKLVHDLSPENAEQFLRLLKNLLSPKQASYSNERGVIRKGFEAMADRVGINYESIPKNGAESGGIVGSGCYELAKCWYTDDSWFRLSMMKVKDVETTLFEQLTINDSTQLTYEARVLTTNHEGSTAISVAN